jgi:deazaflavin-dependent oxidoreductase (nitroreductase family)
VPGVEDLGGHQFCYLTTVGRRTGGRHEIEIWYAADGSTLYVLSGGGDKADWVRNLVASPGAEVRLGDVVHRVVARILDEPGDEEATARRLVFEKYQPRYDGDLTRWRQRSLPVALDISDRAGV